MSPSRSRTRATNSTYKFVRNFTIHSINHGNDGFHQVEDSMCYSSGVHRLTTNIYAHYSQIRQRVTMPAGATKFSLIYGGNAVEQIAFSQATPVGNPMNSTSGMYGQNGISGTFSLWFDANDDGYQDDGEVTAPINFFEDAFNSGDAATYDPAILIQNALPARHRLSRRQRAPGRCNRHGNRFRPLHDQFRQRRQP